MTRHRSRRSGKRSSKVHRANRVDGSPICRTTSTPDETAPSVATSPQANPRGLRRFLRRSIDHDFTPVDAISAARLTFSTSAVEDSARPDQADPASDDGTVSRFSSDEQFDVKFSSNSFGCSTENLSSFTLTGTDCYR